MSRRQSEKLLALDDYQGLRKHTPYELLLFEWERLKQTEFRNSYALRVFDGDIYSLITHGDFYEHRRKGINVLLFHWDELRHLAFSTDTKKDWSERMMERTEENQKKVLKIADYVQKWLENLQVDLLYLDIPFGHSEEY